MAKKKKASRRSWSIAKKSPSRTAAWRNDRRPESKLRQSEAPLEPTEILTEKRSGEDRRPEEERGGSEVPSAVMDVEEGTWTGQERRESERRVLPDRRKTA